MKIYKLILVILVSVVASCKSDYRPDAVVVGVPTILSGDLSVLGTNIVKTIETYKKRRLRHPIEFEIQDAKIGSKEGLNAYEYLINLKHVDMLIGGTTSDATLAAKQLINKSKTVFITPLTGGSNIDEAGPYIFRIGNSDILNAHQQAEYFIHKGMKQIALITEQTEYTQDIATHFRKRFSELGGILVYDADFLPNDTDFRTQIVSLRSKNPNALFMSTQSGLAFGIFIKQLRELGSDRNFELHTNFLAASNPDAFQIAGKSMVGVHFMAPYYDRGPRSPYHTFLAEYREDHHLDPAIPFHTAGTVDALDMLQDYLDRHQEFNNEEFQQYLLHNIKNYDGLMGSYSFDDLGNSHIGFEPTLIEQQWMFCYGSSQ